MNPERNDRTKTAKGRIADFDEFSQFVCEQAELATAPVFSEENVIKAYHNEKRQKHSQALPRD